MQGVMNYSLRGDLGSFTPTPEEIAIAEQFLAHAKGGEPGTISGEAAVSLFSASGLPITTLSEIWSIADHKKLGVLRMRGTLVAVRLMGWAQRGFSVAETLLLQGQSIIYSYLHSTETIPL
jgi:epidermal growth factor receptor substrate 15